MNWLKKHYKSVIIYALIYIVVMLFFTYPMPYYIDLPGGVESAQEIAVFENPYPSSGSFNSSYVTVITRPSPFQYLMGKRNDKAVIGELGVIDSSLSNAEISFRDSLYKKSSVYNSLIVAYKAASKDLSITENGLVIVNFYNTDTPAYDNLEVGDIITGVNGQSVHNYEDIAELLGEIDCNVPFDLTLLRDEKEMTINLKKEKRNNDACLLGITPDHNYTFINYDVDYDKSNPQIKDLDMSGYGPSAGLIQTLSIYNKLIPTDITFGLKIAGTGTIDENGNVGIIGGIQQKVFGAAKADVDIFFAPNYDYKTIDGKIHNNYKDALKARDIMDSDMIVVPVKTFDDAITYLMDHYG